MYYNVKNAAVELDTPARRCAMVCLGLTYHPRNANPRFALCAAGPLRGGRSGSVRGKMLNTVVIDVALNVAHCRSMPDSYSLVPE